MGYSADHLDVCVVELEILSHVLRECGREAGRLEESIDERGEVECCEFVVDDILLQFVGVHAQFS